LQVQQEELRTANEELEEQSRVLEESQASLENQKAELEQTNEQLAEQGNALDQKTPSWKAQLDRSARDLERASQYKSQFLANMSHELRTPLNSSLILAKLLAENARQPQRRAGAFANTIYSAGNDLLNLINDILDISKVEAGKLDLVPEQLSARHVVEGMAMVFEPLAQQKNWPSSWWWPTAAAHGDRPPAPGADPQEPAVERAQVHQRRADHAVGAGARR
jgi:signal transduction histidine kinase